MQVCCSFVSQVAQPDFAEVKQTVSTLVVGLKRFPLSLSFKKLDSAVCIAEPSALQQGIHDIFF